MPDKRPLFALGKVFCTPGASCLLDQQQVDIRTLLVRHVTGDWAEMSKDDQRANRQAVRVGARVLSAYQLESGAKIWIITEADRHCTTLLLPTEY